MYSSSLLLSALSLSTRSAHCGFLLATARLPALLVLPLSDWLVLLIFGGIMHVRLRISL